MNHWIENSIFYHIYPLGFCGAPQQNDFTSSPINRLEKVESWLDHIQGLGANALYLGPLFESTRHGYDTADYYHIDRRLGDRAALRRLSDAMHQRGMRLVLDGVFNHVGRDFWAFRDVRERGQASPYQDWFRGLTFNAHSPYGDPFTYESWSGHYSLVRLNQGSPAVREHLFEAVRMWVEELGIDGLRLDVADSLEPDFRRALSTFCKGLRSDFWLMGEVIHGNYSEWANPEMLDSVTNYEVYKSLYSSHVDRNYFELAYALNRQSGENGLYSDRLLYTFADNHDVDRVAEKLKDPAHLYPLYLLLFTMPGVPSIYYGSEWGIGGRRTEASDEALRPCLNLSQLLQSSPHPILPNIIARLVGLRHSVSALRTGAYRQLDVRSEQFAFLRQSEQGSAVVAINMANTPAEFDLSLPPGSPSSYTDGLEPGSQFSAEGGRLRFSVPARWGRVLLPA